MDVSPRKLPRQSRSAQSRDCIIEAAAHILAGGGLAAYNTNAIAEHAGVSIGSLYQYFPRKEAITAALIERSHQALIANMRAVLAETEAMGFGAALAYLVQRAVTTQLSNPKLDRLLEIEEERLPKTPEVRALEAEIEALNREFLARYLDPARCPEAQLSIVAADVVCILRGMMDRALNRPEVAADPHGLIARLIRILAGYLGPLARQTPKYEFMIAALTG